MNLQGNSFLRKYLPYFLSLCFIVVFPLLVTEKVFAQASHDKAAAPVTGITAGRAQSILTGVVGLVSVVIGWRARGRSTGSSGWRYGAITALVLGIICVVLSGAHLLNTASRGFGTGSGKAGAIVALLLGMTGIVLSGLALRPKRA